MMKRDLYDSNRGITDRTIFFNEKIEEGLFCLKSIIFILNEKGEILFIKNKENFSFIYDYPEAAIAGRKSVINKIERVFNVKVLKKEIELFKTIKTNNEFIDLYLIKTKIENIPNDMGWCKLKEVCDFIETGKLTKDIQFYKYLLQYLKTGHKDVIKRITCKGIIIEDDEVILMYRAKGNDVYYVAPGGGVESGETLEETVLRELKEEINADAQITNYIGVEENETTVYHFYKCTKSNSDLKIIGPEKERITEDNYYEIRKLKKNELKKHKVYGINEIMKAFEIKEEV